MALRPLSIKKTYFFIAERRQFESRFLFYKLCGLIPFLIDRSKGMIVLRSCVAQKSDGLYRLEDSFRPVCCLEHR